MIELVAPILTIDTMVNKSIDSVSSNPHYHDLGSFPQRFHLDLETLGCGSLREIILAGQVITEILIFIVFFLLLSGTYLFQVGLIGQLSKYLLPVFYSFPLYLGLTIWSGFARDSILRGYVTSNDMFHSSNSPTSNRYC